MWRIPRGARSKTSCTPCQRTLSRSTVACQAWVAFATDHGRPRAANWRVMHAGPICSSCCCPWWRALRQAMRVSRKAKAPETGCDPVPSTDARRTAGGRTLAMQLRIPQCNRQSSSAGLRVVVCPKQWRLFMPRHPLCMLGGAARRSRNAAPTLACPPLSAGDREAPGIRDYFRGK